MGIGITNRRALDSATNLELVLELLDFSGGVNTISEDQATKLNEARVIKNWIALSQGGMTRAKGFNEVISGTAYTNAPDLLIQHDEGGTSELFAIVEGDLLKKSGSDFALDHASDNNAFTSGQLSHAVSVGDQLFITNVQDNLYRKVLGSAVAAVTNQPAQAYARVYNHKNRLYVEGATNTPERVQGSRVGEGNWNSSDTWTKANDAFSVDLPEPTKGLAPNIPSGNEIMVFSKTRAYALSNFPNVAYRPLPNSHGCSAPLSIAQGSEGVFFFSEQPTLGVYLTNGVEWINLTENNYDVISDLVNTSGRVYGVYRDRKYYLLFNNTTGTTPNDMWIYDTRFNRWYRRCISSDLSDNFGYPALLKFTNNELYFASADVDKVYEFETDDNSDEGQNTEATYKTKDFSSRDMTLGSGGAFPIDDVRMKLTKVTITYFGNTGSIGLNLSIDRGQVSINKTIDLNQDGDLINSTFQVNSSSIVTSPPDKTKTFSFNNSAVGRRFQLTISNSGTGTRPQIKKIKIHAIAYDEA